MKGLEFICSLRKVNYNRIAKELNLTNPNVSAWIKGIREIPNKYLPELSKMFYNIPSDFFQREMNKIEELKIRIFFCKLDNDIQELTHLQAELNKVTLSCNMTSKIDSIIEMGDSNKIRLLNTIVNYMSGEIPNQNDLFPNERLIAFQNDFEQLLNKHSIG